MHFLANHNFLSFLTHPFVPQGLLALFIVIEGVKCTGLRSWHKISAVLLGVLFAYAFYGHFFVDTRYLHVILNNHQAQAFYYRIASLWSHHETSLFVWLCILNLGTHMWRLPPDLAQFRSRVRALLNCCFCFYMLVEANPFATTPLAQLASESHGLNPLLYDINMVWHPPLLYAGVTLFFTPYVIGLWLQCEQTAEQVACLVMLVQKQTKIAFGILTLAIALGSFWAFTQLGWGGFWFWDPVETASLLPWIAGLIVFHTKPSTLKQRPWIAGLPFACVMISLWAVRSGMLVSVHSFAHDMMAFWLLGAFAVFAIVPLLYGIFNTRSEQNLNAFIHFRTVGLWLLGLMLLLLLLALFLPVVLGFSLAPSFFNQTLTPLWICIALLMVLAPYKGIRFGAPLTLALLTLIVYVTYYAYLKMPYLVLGASGAFCVGSMIPLIKFKPRLAFAHMGIGLCLVGLASYSDNPPEQTLTLTKGIPLTFQNYDFTYQDTREVIEPFKTNKISHVLIKVRGAEINGNEKKDEKEIMLMPERQFFHSSQLQRSKADFGLLNNQIMLISNIEHISDQKIAVTFFEKSGLFWLVWGVLLIVVSLLCFRDRYFFIK